MPIPCHRSAPRLWTCAAAVLVCALRLAADTAFGAPTYLRTKFTDHEGLSSNIINSILQTKNGMLWIGTALGLDRFDGHRIVHINTKHTRVLVEGPDGDLWQASSEGILRLKADSLDQWTPVQKEEYHLGKDAADAVHNLDITPDGAVLATTSGGIFQLKGRQFERVQEFGQIYRFEPAPEGHFLMIGGGRFLEWDGNKLIEHPEIAAKLGVPADQIFHVIEDRHGDRWYGTINGLARIQDGTVQWCTGPDKKIVQRIFRIYQDAGGQLWAGSDSGVYSVNGETLEPAMMGEGSRAVYVDRDTNLWVGTNGHGLNRCRRRTVQVFTSDDGLPSFPVTTVLTARDGKLWAGSNCGGISWFDGQRFHNLANIENSCVFSMEEDQSGDLWVGTMEGLFRFHNGAFTRLWPAKKEGDSAWLINAIVAGKDGSLWTSGPNGVKYFTEGKVQAFGTAEGLSSRVVPSIFIDHWGMVWAGTLRGLNYLSGNHFLPAANNPSGEVRVLGEDSAGSLYASSTAIGLQQVADRRLSDSLFPEYLRGMLAVGRDLWVSSERITRISQDALDAHSLRRDEPIDYLRLDLPDGLTPSTGSTSQRAIAQTADGKLWFAGFQGLARIDPATLHPAPPVHIYMQEIVVDRTVRGPGHELRLPPGSHHVEIHFDTVEISSPERTHLQYRLDDTETAWFDAEPAHAATYTNIPPGRHRFHVRACNRDGVWDRAGIAYDIVQEPFFYQTHAFQLASIAAGILVLFGLHRFRLRQISAHMKARLEERLTERERIARELHDTLLQGFQGLMLHFQGVLKEIPEREPARESMARALGFGDQVLVEGRERVRDLRTEEGKNAELQIKLGSYGEELARGGTVAFKLTASSDPLPLHPVVGDEAYHIAREAMANAFRHAHASLIEVNLTYDPARLCLRVRDDGRGMDDQIVSSGRRDHFGLLGMRERAKNIGAKLNVWSKLGTGTEIEISVPGRIAYPSGAQETVWRKILQSLWPRMNLR